MPRVYVEFAGLKEAGNDCKAVSVKIDSIQSDFQRTIRQLDWDVKYEADINNTANQIARKLERYSQTLKDYQHFLENAYDEYSKLEKTKSFDTKPLLEVVPIDYDKLRPLGPTDNSWRDRMEEYIRENIKKIAEDLKEDMDFLTDIKSLFKAADKWGDIDEAGIFEDVISYISDFWDFFTGDKKGLTGASDWMDLADSSISVWKGVYDYFQDTYKEMETGFFGKIAKKNVAIAGVSAGFLGLLSSVMSASDGLDKKNWQSIVADYVDCGKDVLSVIGSGYKLKHINDVKSLADIKAGLWSALSIYTAIGEAGIKVVSEGFRSHEEYYADGQWSAEDTGATGIDVAMAGIYGISHSLTLGLDDLIFGLVDRASGGNGTSEMSYFEKAAEGYKILANRCGEAIGNWWLDLTN